MVLDGVRITLSRLLAHVDTECVALTGSAAVVAIAPLSSYRTTLNDVDLVASSLDVLGTTVASEFPVSHFHNGPPKFMVQLVDPQTRLRIDLFLDLAGAIERAHQVEGVPIRVLDQDDMAAHKRQTVGRASAARPVDAKHRRDLLSLCGEAPDLPESWFVTERYATDLNARCERCETSRTPEFSLAPKQTIFDLRDTSRALPVRLRR